MSRDHLLFGRLVLPGAPAESTLEDPTSTLWRRPGSAPSGSASRCGGAGSPRTAGADEVIDYTREDVADGGQLNDLILDIGGNRRLSRLRRASPRGGRSSSLAAKAGSGPSRAATPCARALARGSAAADHVHLRHQ